MLGCFSLTTYTSCMFVQTFKSAWVYTRRWEVLTMSVTLPVSRACTSYLEFSLLSKPIFSHHFFFPMFFFSFCNFVCSDMLAEILDIAAGLYHRGECQNLFVDGLFDQLVTAARELPTSHFYGRRFGFQVYTYIFRFLCRFVFVLPKKTISVPRPALPTYGDAPCDTYIGTR